MTVLGADSRPGSFHDPSTVPLDPLWPLVLGCLFLAGALLGTLREIHHGARKDRSARKYRLRQKP